MNPDNSVGSSLVQCDLVARDWDDLLRLTLCMPDALDTMKRLLDAGADPNSFHSNSRTPLGMVLRCSGATPFLPRWQEALEMLLAAGADPNLPCAPGHTPLSMASALPGSKAVELLLQSGASVQVSSGHEPPIHIAITRNANIESMGRLLAAGADPDAADLQGELALAIAIERGQWDKANKLLDYGATVSSSGPLHRSALCVACQAMMSKQGNEFVSRLLGMGVDPNERDMLGRTPLVYATARMYCDSKEGQEALKQLIKYGADPRARDNSGEDIFVGIAGRSGLDGTRAYLISVMLDLDAMHIEKSTLDIGSDKHPPRRL